MRPPRQGKLDHHHTHAVNITEEVSFSAKCDQFCCRIGRCSNFLSFTRTNGGYKTSVLRKRKLTEIEICLPKIANFHNIFTSSTTPYQNVCGFDMTVYNSVFVKVL